MNIVEKRAGVLAVALLLFAVPGFAADAEDTINNSAKASPTLKLTKAVTLSRTGEQINWQVISSGGTKGSTTNYNLNGTVAQTAVGSGSSTNYGLSSGFWQVFGGGSGSCCIGILGSCQLVGLCDDSEQDVDISDLTNMIDHLFISYTSLCCIDESDVAPLMYGGVADGAVDIADLTGIIDHMFINYTPMPPCD